MGITNYCSVNGRIRAEASVGGERVDYRLDGFGSIIAKLGPGGALLESSHYSAFGLTEFSTGGVGFLGWGGSASYFSWGALNGDLVSIGQRMVSKALGRWESLVFPWKVYSKYSTHFRNYAALSSSVPMSKPKRVWINDNSDRPRYRCAYVVYKTSWNVPDLDANTTGSIIQHVRLVSFGMNCKTDRKIPPQRRNFLEAWRVRKGYSRFPDGVDDYYKTALSNDGGDCTSGGFIVHGTSAFYPDFDPVAAGWAPPSDTDSLYTLDLLKNPPPEGFEEGQTYKDLNFFWDCCLDPKYFGLSWRSGPTLKNEGKLVQDGGKKVCIQQC